MQKDDKWFASIKWDKSCLQCQAKTNGACENRSCAEDNYDLWGDPIPAYVYHHDGNTLNEYLENKRKRIESRKYIPTSPTASEQRQHVNVDTSITLKDLDLPARVTILIRRHFEAESEDDYKYHKAMSKQPDARSMKLRLVRKYEASELPLHKLKENGLTSVQGRSKATQQLLKYINSKK